ncbi:putative RNA-directed DNA polymerase from transposon X-element [Trichonephila clavipes]|nr:putative RNA-directed DNA polymerase from transposon X-element [Trichonephila clavipes]
MQMQLRIKLPLTLIPLNRWRQARVEILSVHCSLRPIKLEALPPTTQNQSNNPNVNLINQSIQGITQALTALTVQINNMNFVTPSRQINNRKNKSKEARKQQMYITMISRPMIGLSLISWNANDILNKILEFKIFVEKYSPDVILVQETHLRPVHNISVANYKCYRNDRVTDGPASSGTLVFIKKSIPHFNTPTPQLYHIEATTVTINP